MTPELKLILGFLVYIAIVVFLCTIADELGFIDSKKNNLITLLACIWPLTLAILIGTVVIAFPKWLAKAVMERVKRRKEERED